MAIMASEPQSNYVPCPEGLQQAVCCDVVDIGVVENTFRGGMDHKVRIVFQSETQRDDGKPYEVSIMLTLSLHEKAKLRKLLEVWRGRKFTGDELKGFDLEKLIGVHGQVQVVHAIKDGGKTYANVAAIVPLGKGMDKLAVAPGYTRFKDRAGVPGDVGDGGAADADDIAF